MDLSPLTLLWLGLGCARQTKSSYLTQCPTLLVHSPAELLPLPRPSNTNTCRPLLGAGCSTTNSNNNNP